MIQISREAIKQLASSDTVYYRGMRYYADRAVSQVTWSKQHKQYRAVVRGSNQYMVTVSENKETMEIEYSCNCPAHIKYPGACKHVIATLLFISDYNDREEKQQSLSGEDKRAYQVIEYFKKREYKQLKKMVYHVRVIIELDALLHRNSGKAAISLLTGCDRMYKVSNIKKFLSDYYFGNPITLGREFHFNPSECTLDSQSKKTLGYLLDIYELQELSQKNYYSNLFSGAKMLLPQNILYKLLKNMNHSKCNLDLFGKVYEDVQVLGENPMWQLKLYTQGDELVLESGEDRLIPLSEDGKIMFFQHNLYLPDQEYVWNVLPFFASLGKEPGMALTFRGDIMQDFMEHVLPGIQRSLKVEIPKQLQDKYVVGELEAKLYLDVMTRQHKKYITAEVKFSYQGHDFNPLSDKKEKSQIVLVRDIQREEQLLTVLYDLQFTPYGTSFVLKTEDAIYDFFTQGIKRVMEVFTVYYSDAYRKMGVTGLSRGNVQISLNRDNNLLELEVNYPELPMEELGDFFKALKLKRRFYRLKNGSFLSLDRQDFAYTLENLYTLLAQGKKITEQTVIYDKNQAFYLDNFLQEWEQMDVVKESAYEHFVDRLKYLDTEKTEVPDNLKAELRPYQVVGYHWLCSLASLDLGGILADDMGLGKTLQSICYICRYNQGKTLIVAPSSLMLNWQEEFGRFAPHMKTCIVSGTPKEREGAIALWDEVQVFITSYPLLRKDIQKYKDCVFENMIIDEAQYIKNLGSLCAKSVKQIKAKHRFALTGTPIENSLSELWSIFDYVMPGYLPKYAQFLREFEKPIVREGSQKALDELMRHIRPFILRRMKDEVLSELPDKMETRLTATMTPSQEKAYVAYLSTINKQYEKQLASYQGAAKLEVLALITRLRQICCHPATFMDNYQGESGKLELLMELVEQLIAGNHTILIFSQFTSMLELMCQRLQQENISYFLLQGNTKLKERADMVKRFNKGEVPVFLISLKAGGTGLNLTGADTVIHYDPWWNPAVEDQATDRAYRIGQDKNVQVFKLVTKGTIEEKIYRLQEKKRKISDAVIQSQEEFIQNLSEEEWMSLFTYEG